MKVKAIIYDFDGPVNDSFREGMRRIKILCAAAGVPFGQRQRRLLAEQWGIPGAKLLKIALGIPKEAADDMYRQWERVDLATPMPLVPGAKEVLHWARRNGFVNCLLTTRNKKNIRDIFKKIDMVRHFKIRSCRQDTPYRKPDKRAFLYVQEQLKDRFGITFRNCIFVGDTPADIDAGNAASIRTLIVQTGPYGLEHAETHPMPLGDVLRDISYLPMWLERNHSGNIRYEYE